MKNKNSTNSELLDFLKSKYSKAADRQDTLNQMSKHRVKNTICSLCEKYLTKSGQVFSFEVLPKELSFAIMAIDEEPLKSMYDIRQVSETMFQASLKELSL